MSKIAPVAVTRILNSPLGQQLLALFEAAEQAMELGGNTECFNQLGYILPSDPVEEGQLIPTLHISLRPIEAMTVSIPVEVSEED